MHRITEVDVLEDYRLALKFSDGTEGVADVSHLVGKGVFSLWNEYREFRKVCIGSSGELLWDEDVELCPDALYLKVTGKQPEDIFPRLKGEFADA